jgi:hypothetical protein
MAIGDGLPSSNELRGTIAAAAVATGMFALVAVGTGAGISIRAVLGVFTLLILGTFLTRQSADYTLGFVLVTIALLMVLAEYVLPGFIVSPFGFFAGLLDAFLGIDTSEIESWQFFVLSVFTVAVVIAARIRYSGAGKYADTVFDRTLRELLKYVRVYLSFGRSIAIFLLGVLFIFAEQIASVMGVIGDRLAQTPFIASNFVVALGGYASLGGDIIIVDSVPLFGSLSALDFLVFSVVVIGVAAASKYNATGSLGRLVGRN